MWPVDFTTTDHFYENPPVYVVFVCSRYGTSKSKESIRTCHYGTSRRQHHGSRRAAPQDAAGAEELQSPREI